jgi:predicted nucleic acid-binding protein
MYLVDTSVWVDYLRGKLTDQVRALKNLLSGTEMVGTAPIILQEILQGADSPKRYEKWKTYFTDLYCYVSSDPVATHIAAARLYMDCRKTGKTPRSSNDCLIAQIAIENRLTLLHNDRDFISIAGVDPRLKLHPSH